MSGGKDASNEPDADAIENKGGSKKQRYLKALASGLGTFVGALRSVERAEAATTEQQRADEHTIATATKGMERATWFLFAATVASVGTAVITAFILNSQLEDSKSANRAYVFVRGITYKISHSGGAAGYDWLVPWENTGNTPPKHLQVWATFGPYDYVFQRYKEKRGMSLLLGPRAIAEQAIGSVMASYVVDSIYSPQIARKQSRHGYYIIGRATYDDAYQTPHITEFCYYAHFTEITPEGLIFWQCRGIDAKHNCTDDDCPQDAWNPPRKRPPITKRPHGASPNP